MTNYSVYKLDGIDLHHLGNYRAVDPDAALVEACSVRPALHWQDLVPIPCGNLLVAEHTGGGRHGPLHQLHP